MKKKIEIRELAEQYLAVADTVTLRIGERNEALKFTLPHSKRAAALKRELGILYRERRDAVETARRLFAYCA